MKDLPALPWIYAISDGSLSQDGFARTRAEFVHWIRELSHAGVSIIQIREKLITTRQLYQLSQEAAVVTAEFPTVLLINDRADVAAAAGADGVHLTGRSISIENVRKAFAGLRIAVSTHTMDEVGRAAKAGVDLAVFGPVFASPDKGPSVGLSQLRSAVDAAGGMPVLGLGGMTADNAAGAIETGASGVSGIRGLRSANQIQKLRHLIPVYDN